MNPNYLWRLTNKMIQQVGVYLEESLQTNKSVYLCKSFPQSQGNSSLFDPEIILLLYKNVLSFLSAKDTLSPSQECLVSELQ